MGGGSLRWSGEYTLIYTGVPSRGGSPLHRVRIKKIGLHRGGGHSKFEKGGVGNIGGGVFIKKGG